MARPQDRRPKPEPTPTPFPATYCDSFTFNCLPHGVTKITFGESEHPLAAVVIPSGLALNLAQQVVKILQPKTIDETAPAEAQAPNPEGKKDE